ncbi:hypothetical protein Tco_0574753, partial [Tanacetum coccineum]
VQECSCTGQNRLGDPVREGARWWWSDGGGTMVVVVVVEGVEQW